MPLPVPTPSENQEQFISRCMGDDKVVSEFPDESQRYAVCEGQWVRGEAILKSLYPEGEE
jgi:hypothetical protein